ncbi:hypothetical protein [Streptomyces sp. NPDC017086]|uniref:hypothetical protein n=1 Tax=Streptomyces sp. NPDC017086 TaxID=3364976 RepID=UPI0037A5F087
MGGWVQSRIQVDPQQSTSDSLVFMSALGKDNTYWFRVRYPNGTWTGWQVSCLVEPDGRFCP